MKAARKGSAGDWRRAWRAAPLLLAALVSVSGLRAAPGASGIPRFPLVHGPLELSGPVNPWRFIKSVGENSGVWGFENGRLEGWVYPVKVFHDFHLTFETAAGTVALEADALARAVRVFPHMTQLTYASRKFSVVETIFAPRQQPGFVVLLEVRTRDPLRVVVRFKPDLNLMWPAALAGQTAEWDDARRRLRLDEPSGRYAALIGSPAAVGARLDERNLGRNPRPAALELSIDPQQAAHVYYPIVVAGGIRGVCEAAAVYDRLLQDLPALVESSRRHYVDVDRSATVFETPDPAVNEALRWSRLSLDQLHVCNPNLPGCGFVAGYRSSGDGNRPNYAWFYKEPTIAARAFLESGAAASLREAFRFLRQFQRDDGKAVHEVPQSAEGRDWLKGFRWAYTHTNTSLFYVSAVCDYFRYTGDAAFLAESWPSVRKAYDYTVSLLDPADGLIRIPIGDWGSTETRDDVAKDANLAGQWVATLDAMREMALAMHQPSLAGECARRARTAADSLEREFWNPEIGYYNYGVDRSGGSIRLLRPEIAFSAWWGSLPEGRARAVLRRLSTAAFLTDWGQRVVSLDDPEYREGVYEGGSVWPFRSAGALLAHFRYHRALQGFSLWMAMMRLRYFHARGSMPEVLSGDCYRLLDEGVPHQMFSELTVIPGLVNGIVGLEPDPLRRTVRVAPHLPPTWPTLSLSRLPVGGGQLSLRFYQSAGLLSVDATLSSTEPMELDFAPALPAGSQVVSVRCDGRSVPFTVAEQPEDLHVRVRVPLGPRKRVIEVSYHPGVAVDVEWAPVLEGDQSANLRVIDTRYHDHRLELDVQGRPARSYRLHFYTNWQVRAIDGVESLGHEKGRVTAVIAAPAAAVSRPDRAGYLSWTVRVAFVPAAP